MITNILGRCEPQVTTLRGSSPLDSSECLVDFNMLSQKLFPQTKVKESEYYGIPTYHVVFRVCTTYPDPKEKDKNKIEIRTEHFPRFQLSTKENDENLYDEVVS